MPGKRSTVHLTTPAPDGKTNPYTIIKPSALRTWIDNLPYANPLGMTQAVLASLKLLNRHPGKVAQRTKLMLIYIEPFRKIIDMARKVRCHTQEGQSQSRDSSEILELASVICTEMSYGFKHIVNTENQTKNKTASEDLASHIQLAMHCLALGLMFEMSSYHAESRSAWREIFQLLMRAQQLGITSLTIPKETLQVDYEVSVLNTFKCILLTSILDSSRLLPEEIWASHDYLQWHAKAARLLPVEQASKYSGNYLIPRDGQVRPILYNNKKPPSILNRYMICETHKLNQQVNQHIEIISMDESAFIHGTDHHDTYIRQKILKEMLYIWHTNPKRKHQRTEKFDRLSCAFGIVSVHHFLQNGSIRNISSLPDDDQYSISGDYLVSRPGDPKSSNGLHDYEFIQENISATGTGILSTEPNIHSLKIGQLILVESKIRDTAEKMRVGIVRRIAKEDQTTREVGIQYLPGKVLPATALPEIFGRKHHVDLQPCLILELGEFKPKAIITPHLIYQEDRNYVVDIKKGDTKRIIAGKLLESTSSFDCFEYSVLQLH